MFTNFMYNLNNVHTCCLRFHTSLTVVLYLMWFCMENISSCSFTGFWRRSKICIENRLLGLTFVEKRWKGRINVVPMVTKVSRLWTFTRPREMSLSILLSGLFKEFKGVLCWNSLRRIIRLGAFCLKPYFVKVYSVFNLKVQEGFVFITHEIVLSCHFQDYIFNLVCPTLVSVAT